MFDSVEEIERADRTKIVQYLMAITPGGLAEGESTNDLRAAAIESFETEDMAKAMAHQMEQDNPRFDKHRFLDACCE